MEIANTLEKVETNKKFLEQLKQHEGFRNFVYQCSAGHWTVGYGHNLDSNPVKGICRESIITMERAEELLKQDVAKFAAQLDSRLPWWRRLSLPRQAVLLNMAFNLGMTSLLGFKYTLAFIKTGKYDVAAKGMLSSKWASQVKGRAKQLAEQMRTGEWQ